MEHHISADIGYALWNYYLTTGDEKFMKFWGYEMLVEIARFWASRVKYNKKEKVYEIKNVIGPNEFHINVDNNFYTNLMAKWSLTVGVKVYKKIPNKVKKKIKLTPKEIEKWREISEKMKLYIPHSKVIEQFDGYFRLKDYPVLVRNKYGISLFPEMKTEDFSKTKLIKQPDLMMGMILLEEMVEEKIGEMNYNYYKEKIVHKSSLSPAILSIAGMRYGDIEEAYNLLKFGAKIDLYDLYKNTACGIHGAAVGGLWQGVIFGVMGIKIKENWLEINPKLPEEWEELKVNFLWRKRRMEIKLKDETLEVKINSKKKEIVKIKIKNKEYKMLTNKRFKFSIGR
jgi:trehalose/maltose hydrolase-like predicted phosphorylase